VDVGVDVAGVAVAAAVGALAGLTLWPGSCVA
jgi:hypothetical protein